MGLNIVKMTPNFTCTMPLAFNVWAFIFHMMNISGNHLKVNSLNFQFHVQFVFPAIRVIKDPNQNRVKNRRLTIDFSVVCELGSQYEVDLAKQIQNQ